jgi:hypothetical protein
VGFRGLLALPSGGTVCICGQSGFRYLLLSGWLLLCWLVNWICDCSRGGTLTNRCPCVNRLLGLAVEWSGSLDPSAAASPLVRRMVMDVAPRERSWRPGHPYDDPRRRGILRYPNVLHPSHRLCLPCAFHVWLTRSSLWVMTRTGRRNRSGACAVRMLLPVPGGNTTNGRVRPWGGCGSMASRVRLGRVGA